MNGYLGPDNPRFHYQVADDALGRIADVRQRDGESAVVPHLLEAVAHAVLALAQPAVSESGVGSPTTADRLLELVDHLGKLTDRVDEVAQAVGGLSSAGGVAGLGGPASDGPGGCGHCARQSSKVPETVADGNAPDLRSSLACVEAAVVKLLQAMTPA